MEIQAQSNAASAYAATAIQTTQAPVTTREPAMAQAAPVDSTKVTISDAGRAALKAENP